MTLLSRALAEGEDRMPETDAARQATHWVGCERVHHACALAELERLRQDARRFYRTDGSSDLLDSPQDVICRRVEAAGEIVRLRAERDQLIDRNISVSGPFAGRPSYTAFPDSVVEREFDTMERARAYVRRCFDLAPDPNPAAPEPPR